jgi:hypothetical protein
MTTEMPTRGPLLLVAALASAAAGLVHAAAAGAHTGVANLGVLFALAAALQLGWAALVVVHPVRLLLLAGAALNAAMILAWAMAITVGWPVVAAMADPIPVGFQDLAAAILAAVAVVGALMAWQGARVPAWFGAAPASALATVLLLGLAVPAVAGSQTLRHAHHGDDHAHTDDHAHDDGHIPADDDGDHAHDDDGDHPPAAGSAYDHDDPIISLDDPRLSDNQRLPPRR